MCQLKKLFEGLRQEIWKEQKRTTSSVMRDHWFDVQANQYFLPKVNWKKWVGAQTCSHNRRRHHRLHHSFRHRCSSNWTFLHLKRQFLAYIHFLLQFYYNVSKFFEVKKQKGCKVGWKNPPFTLRSAKFQPLRAKWSRTLLQFFFRKGGAFLSGTICKKLFFPIDDRRFQRSTISCLLPAAVLTFYPAE